MSLVQLQGPVVEADWVIKNLNGSNLVILDATLPKAVSSDGSTDLPQLQISGARFFDIKRQFSDFEATYPNTCQGKRHLIAQQEKLVSIMIQR